jgi:hypothetical protein
VHAIKTVADHGSESERSDGDTGHKWLKNRVAVETADGTFQYEANCHASGDGHEVVGGNAHKVLQ